MFFEGRLVSAHTGVHTTETPPHRPPGYAQHELSSCVWHACKVMLARPALLPARPASRDLLGLCRSRALPIPKIPPKIPEDVVGPVRARTNPECTSTRVVGGRRASVVGRVDRASPRVRTHVRCVVRLLYRRRDGERFTVTRVHHEQRAVRAVGYYVLRPINNGILVRLGRLW